MAKLNDLYLKYANEIGPVLEEDGAFQYLYETLENGQNVMDQQSVILHKTVDEEWINVIEDSLDAIFKVIAEPRRFIKTTEELVPVDLAKKITGDSVRHLSQNTQFIANNEEGNVTPTKILNVTVEETYDLYENRFIYHLIQRLVTFIDKRTDVIFWATGDERFSTLKFTSAFEDESEKIEYELSMKISDKTESENENDHMSIFSRIDRIRRQVMQLRRSYFCEVMAGCARVKSPIQRTNLLTKDHYYRKCLDLWHFLERYESIGYTIDEEKRALQFDEEYIFQFYTNVIANYATFKSLMDPDKRNIEKDTYKFKKKVRRRPKFLKSIKEEFKDSPNLEDVEIRKIFVDYVTLAQLEAEEKQREAEKKQLEAEEKQREAEKKQREAEIKQKEAEDKQHAAELIAADAQRKQAEAEAQAAETKRQCDITVAKTIEEAEQKIDAANKAAEARIVAAQQAAEEKADARAVAAEQAADARAVAAEQSADARVAEAQLLADSKVMAAKQEADVRISAAEYEAAGKVRDAELRVGAALNDRAEAFAAKENAEKAARESDAHAIQAFKERDLAIRAKEMAEAISMHAESDKAHAIEQAEESIKKARDMADRLTETARIETTRAQEEKEHAEKMLRHAEELSEQARIAEAAAKRTQEEAARAGKKAEKEALKMLAKMEELTLPQYLALRREIKSKDKK